MIFVDSNSKEWVSAWKKACAVFGADPLSFEDTKTFFELASERAKTRHVTVGDEHAKFWHTYKSTGVVELPMWMKFFILEDILFIPARWLAQVIGTLERLPT